MTRLIRLILNNISNNMFIFGVFFNVQIAITIALGYDSYVVIRHGIPSEKFDNKLGCYFCNDIVVPGNVSS